MHPQALHPAPGLLASPQLPVQIQAAGKVRLVIKPTYTTRERLTSYCNCPLPPCAEHWNTYPLIKLFIITSQALPPPANLAPDSLSSNTARTHDSITSNHQRAPAHPPSLRLGSMCPKPIKCTKCTHHHARVLFICFLSNCRKPQRLL